MAERGALTTSEPTRVSTLELFFDLVFVFTITQVAFIVERRSSWSSAAQALTELAVIYWMYGGFAWLTNTRGSQTQRQRIVLLLGMAAFLVVSLSVPRAFGSDGVAFGWAYLALTAVHLGGFVIGGEAGAVAAMRSIGAQNLGAALLILVAGYASSPWHWPLWIGAVAVQWAPALLTRAPSAFSISSEHFAERHGLMIIIVLGESIVSVALAAQAQPVTVRLVVGVLCGLAASAAMWWCYFAGDDAAAEAAFGRAADERRGTLALVGYDLPHLLMMAGVVAVAAGSRLSLPDLTARTTLAAALLLSGGAALYLAALALFRVVLGFAPVLPRLVTAALVVAAAPVGREVGAAQQLAAVAAIIGAMLVAERAFVARRTPRPAGQAG